MEDGNMEKLFEEERRQQTNLEKIGGEPTQ